MKNSQRILMLFVLLTQTLFAQKSAPENWFNLDLKKDKIPGVSTERAYNEFLKGKQAQKVIVAVIDGGTEVAHEDLKDLIWVNEKEIPGNNLDDDNNGYVDDINGWSFLGGNGGDVVEETLEITRIYRSGKDKYSKVNVNSLSESEKMQYEIYVKAAKQYEAKRKEASSNLGIYTALIDAVSQLQKHTGTENPTPEQIKTFQTNDPFQKAMVDRLYMLSKKGIKLTMLKEQLTPAIEHFTSTKDFHLNTEFNPRDKVGDNPDNPTEQFYGCNRVSGPKGEHGTHVAGIIGAMRNNNIGMNGVNNHLRLMVLRVVPDGDERDKDIANAIRYAVDNGAKVVNMSFGKSFSPDKKVVDEAIKYAEQKNVLLIHAAGNDAKNTDEENNFPRDILNDGREINNWIEVGASNWQKGKKIAADFSNYGKTNVDVFAPGVDIYSCIPESKYASYNGTSMAAPVTAGVASLILSYYPNLTPVQVKQIILESSVKVKGKVFLPGSDKKKKVKMTELCKTGGIVNAYEALKMADKMAGAN